MKKNSKLLISSALVTLSFLMPHMVYSMDNSSDSVEQKKSSSIQLTRKSDYILEKILGSGNNIFLKMSIHLDIPKAPLDKEQIEVPIRLFLTDSEHSPTNHPSVEFTVTVDCESTPLTCVLPNKPESFDSYPRFMKWVGEGYLKNETRIKYGFHVDAQKLAPSLAQHLFALPPNGHQFIGTHVIENSLIKPDQCVTDVDWHSKRGTVNATTATLRGTLYFKNQPCPIDHHQQIFPHLMISQKVLKKDETKKFYHRNWLAQSQITTMATYEEFPRNQVNEWPNAPCQTYSLLRQKPGDLKEICHKVCWDGLTGESVDISDGKIFMMDVEDITEKSSEFLNSTVIDEKGKYFIMHYLYPATEEEKNNLRSLEEEAGRLAIANAVRREEVKAEKEKTREAAKQNIENLKKQVDIHIKAYEAEQQREENEKVALREKFALSNSRIDTTIQRLKELQHDKLMYEELVSVLDAMEDHYDDGTEKDMMRVWREKIVIEVSGFSYNEWRRRIGIIVGGGHQKGIVRSSEHDQRHLTISVALLKKDVSEMMDKYRLLSGTPHPRWYEFSKM